MEHTEAPMPTITFAELSAPVYRIKIRIEHSFIIFTYHQFALRVIDILVVQCTFLINVDFALRFAEFLTQCINCPVIICVFQRACNVLSYADIVSYVSQLVVRFVTQTA